MRKYCSMRKKSGSLKTIYVIFKLEAEKEKNIYILSYERNL